MSFVLDRYLADKKDFQGAMLHELAKKEEAVLAEIFPGAYERYGKSTEKAAGNVGRIAASEALHAFIIRWERLDIAHGIATIIFNQTIIHPSLGRITGHDMDYWLGEEADSDPKAHRDVASRLIMTASNEFVNDPGQRALLDLPLFAALRPQQPRFPVGLAKIMEPIGEPSVIQTDPPEDKYGITKGGAPLQLYTRGRIAY